MKIIQATETYGPGGAEQVIITLSTALRAAGHDVSVLLLRPGWLADRLAALEIPVHRLDFARPLDLHFLRSLTALLRDLQPDVLHTHEFTFALYGRIAGRIAGIPVVSTAHGANFVAGPKRRWIGAPLLRPDRRFRMVAVSDALAAQVAKQLLVPVDRINVIRNGINLPPLRNGSHSEDRGTFRLVAVGNLYPVKNHAALVRVVARLRSRGVPAELDILGRGDEESSLRNEIAGHDLTGSVRLQGFRPDVGAFLEAAHVFVSASVSEQMPISFLEAMGRGLPIVASRVGGVPEIVDDGKDGLLFSSGDEESAAERLERLWRDPELRDALGWFGRRKVETHYSTPAMVEAYLRLYATVAPSRAVRPVLPGPRPVVGAPVSGDVPQAQPAHRLRRLKRRIRLLLTNFRDSVAYLPLRGAALPERIRRVVFVCMGNICRSAFAEALLKASPAASCLMVDSCGLIVPGPCPSPPEAQRGAEAFGVDLQRHVSKPWDRCALNTADLIIAMEYWQYRQLIERMPDKQSSIKLLREFAPFPENLLCNIDDPFGQDPDTVARCFGQIKRAVDALASHVSVREVRPSLVQGRKSA